MSLYREKIEKGKIKELFPKPKAGIHRWMKNQMNRFLRRKPVSDDERGCKTNRKPVKGWEY